MRLLVEAMCANFGGIRTYVEHLLAAWPDTFPDDELHVLLRRDSDIVLDSRLIRHDEDVRRPAALGRPLAQTQAMPVLAKELQVDAVLATSASTTLRHPGRPMALVHYDLRHELRPDQFSRTTRLMRAISYRRGYAIADGIVSISRRSLGDLHRLHPSTAHLPATVAHLGADHVDTWPRQRVPGPAITFAHHSNKNLDLSLEGWRLVTDEFPHAKLLVLGLGRTARAQASEHVHQLDLAEHVTLAPFLPEHEFRSLFASSSLILFPSDFEGFGLPVAEGLRLGIPVVIGPEAATQEVADGHAEVMRSWTPEALAEAVRAAHAWGSQKSGEARAYARRFTWAQTARETRALLVDLAGRGSEQPDFTPRR